MNFNESINLAKNYITEGKKQKISPNIANLIPSNSMPKNTRSLNDPNIYLIKNIENKNVIEDFLYINKTYEGAKKNFTKLINPILQSAPKHDNKGTKYKLMDSKKLVVFESIEELQQYEIFKTNMGLISFFKKNNYFFYLNQDGQFNLLFTGDTKNLTLNDIAKSNSSGSNQSNTKNINSGGSKNNDNPPSIETIASKGIKSR
jgi:hypothetical protein